MKLSRRGLLKSLPAIPLAAKAATEEVEKQLTGTGSVGESTTAGWVRKRLRAGGYLGSDSEESSKILNWFLANGLPAHRLRNIRRRASEEARILDPDIASLHSITIGARIRMQEARLTKRLTEEAYEDLRHDIAGSLWRKQVGVEDW